MPSSLAQVLDHPDVNSLIVRAWLEKASNRRSTLVFGVNVAHVEALAQAFRELEPSVDARVLVGSTHQKTRQYILEDFKAGKVGLLAVFPYSVCRWLMKVYSFLFWSIVLF